jgi:hypothetical protein
MLKNITYEIYEHKKIGSHPPILNFFGLVFVIRKPRRFYFQHMR